MQFLFMTMLMFACTFAMIPTGPQTKLPTMPNKIMNYYNEPIFMQRRRLSMLKKRKKQYYRHKMLKLQQYRFDSTRYSTNISCKISP